MSLLQIHEPGQTPEPHAKDAKPAVGIDLGTTHSVIAHSREQEVTVFADEAGRRIVASEVNYGGEVIRSIKRKMSDAATPVHTPQGDMTPVQISADILRRMKSIAEGTLEEEIAQAVITVPAYFDDTARTATRDAARLAGLEVLRLINEPTAAALAYGLDTQAEGIFAIYDFGGGTFDMSILKLEGGVFQVLSTAGDTQLGGDDIDDAIARKLGISAIEARQVKEALTEADTSNGFSKESLNALATPFIDQTIRICERALQDAALDKTQIDGVVLVGGSTRMPLVKQLVAEFFGKAPLDTIDPDEVVAVGAAIQAEALTTGADHLLLDITPLSLGLETMGGIVEKLIERNTPIPTSVSQEFTTYQDGQSAMMIHVVQGEREMAADCRSLANFNLTGIPPLPANVARIKVTFTIDADGLLTVSAQETTTGIQQRVEVKPSYGLPLEAMEQMLRDSMEHAQDDIVQRLLVEARVDAQRLIHDLTAAMQADSELLNQQEQEALNAQMQQLESVMAGDSRDAIDASTQALHELAGSFAEKRMNKAIASALQGTHIDQYHKEETHA